MHQPITSFHLPQNQKQTPQTGVMLTVKKISGFSTHMPDKISIFSGTFLEIRGRLTVPWNCDRLFIYTFIWMGFSAAIMECNSLWIAWWRHLSKVVLESVSQLTLIKNNSDAQANFSSGINFCVRRVVFRSIVTVLFFFRYNLYRNQLGRPSARVLSDAIQTTE